jgi:hypothetical protein
MDMPFAAAEHQGGRWYEMAQVRAHVGVKASLGMG